MLQQLIFKPFRITIHCTDTPNRQSVSLEAIRAHHKSRGYDDIGYHAVIQPDGSVENGRPLNQKGAHVQGHNRGNLGIALAGNNLFTYAQFQALRRTIDSYRQSFPEIKPWNVFCHCEFDSAKIQGKTCPNLDPRLVLAWYCGHNDDAIASYLIENSRTYKLP